MPVGWWQHLLDKCPLTLETFSELTHPPFNLGTDESHDTYFDGRELAKYLVDKGKFIHPCSRREITRDECNRLDAYVREHRLGDGRLSVWSDVPALDIDGRNRCNVLFAFDHPEMYGNPFVEDQAEEDGSRSLGQALRQSIASPASGSRLWASWRRLPH